MKKLILSLSIILCLIYLTNFIGAISVTKNPGEILDNSTWGNISSLTNKIDVSGDNIKLNGKLYITGELCSVVGGVKKCLGKCTGDQIWNSTTKTCEDCPATYSGGSTQIYDGKCYYRTGKVIGINDIDITHLGTFILDNRLFIAGVYSGGTTTYAGGQIIGTYSGYDLRYESGQTGATKTRWRERLEIPGQ
ncbi:MAG: hypothetical protein N4A38_01345 [Candidatus Gracilibacteria bacterium]|nr:hypothetical protein [Candidatus Gracilibacteria bacterium]